MKRVIIAAALIGLATSPLLAGGRNMVSGAYVEARTAEVFTGGCIMNSEAETVGRQAVLAWKVDRGSFNGINIDGLSVVAALAGDRNLGMTEMGGEKPAVRTAMFVDQRANAAQQIALWRWRTHSRKVWSARSSRSRRRRFSSRITAAKSTSRPRR